MNYLVCGTLDEQLNAWRDGWSPSALLRAYGFGVLVQCDSVRAIGPDPHGDSGDLIVVFTRSDARPGGASSCECFFPIPQGRTMMAALRGALQDELRVCGNHHWGTVTDLRAMSEAFNVGVLIFADNLQRAGTRCLVNVDALRGDFPYYIAIWWNDPVHFRLAQYRGSASLPFRSFWETSALPPELRAHYDLCNPKAPVGSLTRLSLH